jgi:hypothetical protein
MDVRNEKELPLPPGQGMLGDTATHEWRRKDSIPPAPPVRTSDAERAEFRRWQQSASAVERREFEDWRAWQESKRMNPK